MSTLTDSVLRIISVTYLYKNVLLCLPNKELKFKMNTTFDIWTLNDIFWSETDMKPEWFDNNMGRIQDENNSMNDPSGVINLVDVIKVSGVM